MVLIRKTQSKHITVLILIFYLLTVLYFTILNRSIGLHTAQFELFWSYKNGSPETLTSEER